MNPFQRPSGTRAEPVDQAPAGICSEDAKPASLWKIPYVSNSTIRSLHGEAQRCSLESGFDLEELLCSLSEPQGFEPRTLPPGQIPAGFRAVRDSRGNETIVRREDARGYKKRVKCAQQRTRRAGGHINHILRTISRMPTDRQERLEILTGLVRPSVLAHDPPSELADAWRLVLNEIQDCHSIMRRPNDTYHLDGHAAHLKQMGLRARRVKSDTRNRDLRSQACYEASAYEDDLSLFTLEGLPYPRRPRDTQLASSHGEITEGDDMPPKQAKRSRSAKPKQGRKNANNAPAQIAAAQAADMAAQLAAANDVAAAIAAEEKEEPPKPDVDDLIDAEEDLRDDLHNVFPQLTRSLYASKRKYVPFDEMKNEVHVRGSRPDRAWVPSLVAAAFIVCALWSVLATRITNNEKYHNGGIEYMDATFEGVSEEMRAWYSEERAASIRALENLARLRVVLFLACFPALLCIGAVIYRQLYDKYAHNPSRSLLSDDLEFRVLPRHMQRVPGVDMRQHLGASRGAVAPTRLAVGRITQTFVGPREEISQYCRINIPRERNEDREFTEFGFVRRFMPGPDLRDLSNSLDLTPVFQTLSKHAQEETMLAYLPSLGHDHVMVRRVRHVLVDWNAVLRHDADLASQKSFSKAMCLLESDTTSNIYGRLRRGDYELLMEHRLLDNLGQKQLFRREGMYGLPSFHTGSGTSLSYLANQE